MNKNSDKKQKKISISDIGQYKKNKPLVCLTAYSTSMASIIDPYVDIILVGDSVGMVIYGMENTLDVSLDIMINHAKAVVKGTSTACVVVDMPFGTYQQSPQLAFKNASDLLAKTGADAVKLEGGVEMADTIKFLVDRGIPVMGHCGLLPQHVKKYGGYKYQGKNKHSQKYITESALAIEQSGAFSIVLEAVPTQLADAITKKLTITTIGIGASNNCDGQVLVTEDMLGLNENFTPRFVKKYAHINQIIEQAVESYQQEVKDRVFPGKDQMM